MRNITKVRKLRMESLEERTLLAVIAGGFNSSVEFIASETSYDEFIPINIDTPQQTEACPCDNPLPAPSILTGDNGYHVSYGLNNHLITWNKIDNATGYELEYVTSKGEWFTVKTTDDHTVVPNLTYGTNVTYRVRALGDATFGSSDWSATRTFNVCPMDLDGDDFIGPGDYALLSSAWFSTEEDPNWNPSLDIDGDGFVGPGDFSYLSSNWLKDAGDGGLSYPTVEKLTLTVPDSALTVPSITKDSASLAVRVQVDASQIIGIEAGDDIVVSAVGTYENAENDTDVNVPKEVTVVFSVSGRDAYKYNSIPATTVTGEVYPFSSVTLTCDRSAIITDGTIPSITYGDSVDSSVFYLNVDKTRISGWLEGDEAGVSSGVSIQAVCKYVAGQSAGSGKQVIVTGFEVTYRDGVDSSEYMYDPQLVGNDTFEIGTINKRQLTIDVTHATIPSIQAGVEGDDLVVQVSGAAIGNIVGSDAISAVVTATYPNSINTGTTDKMVGVSIQITISGEEAVVRNYLAPVVSGTIYGKILASEPEPTVPTVWIMGIIPKAYIGLESELSWHTDPYAYTIEDLPIVSANNDGKDLQTIINDLDGKRIDIGDKSDGAALFFDFDGTIDASYGTPGQNCDAYHPWYKSLCETGVISDVTVLDDEYSEYEGYPFVLTNQNINDFEVQNTNENTMTFSRNIPSIVVNGITLHGALRTSVNGAEFVGMKLIVK